VTRKANTTTETTLVRCAIYTRVSTIDQAQGEFTSIDNQRELAEAFVKSQGGKNWIAIDEHFDDPGYSAGTVERPALRRLLTAIETGSVDVVVAYRLDRLSRSLSDFMKLMDRFKAANVAFVSVTESFSTDNAVGRLTMGLLATFAEFERATISQRTADKMGAARRRGRWTGGFPVIGYDVHPDGGKLMVNEEEAETVRQIFTLYLDVGSQQATAAELNRRGWRTKSWTTKDGTPHEGVAFDKNHVARLLSNPLYVGKVGLHGQVFPGEHPAIVDQELYDRVQAQLAANNVSGGAVARNRYGHLLRGLLHCQACGCAMSPSVTRRKGRVHRYYVCGNAAKHGWKSCPHPSLPAGQIEGAVVERIACIGRDPGLLQETLAQLKTIKATRQPALVAERRRLDRELARLRDRGSDVVQVGRINTRLSEITEKLAVLEGQSIDRRDFARALALFDEVWACLFPAERERVISLLVERIDFDAERGAVAITFRPTGIRVLAEEIAESQEVVA